MGGYFKLSLLDSNLKNKVHVQDPLNFSCNSLILIAALWVSSLKCKGQEQDPSGRVTMEGWQDKARQGEQQQQQQPHPLHSDLEVTHVGIAIVENLVALVVERQPAVHVTQQLQYKNGEFSKDFITLH